MHPEIAAFFDEHQLPRHLAGPLVERLGRPSRTPTLGADRSFELPDPARDPEHAARADEEVLPVGLPSRYADLGPLGVGGMGEVRRVRDGDLGRTCALKVMLHELVGRPALLARFEEEARVVAQLQHPNIPPVDDGGRLADGRPWFTMKEVRGRTLTELVHELHVGEIAEASLRRLADVFAKVCDAVGYAHARGVVHRDLKPDNVIGGRPRRGAGARLGAREGRGATGPRAGGRAPRARGRLHPRGRLPQDPRGRRPRHRGLHAAGAGPGGGGPLGRAVRRVRPRRHPVRGALRAPSVRGAGRAGRAAPGARGAAGTPSARGRVRGAHVLPRRRHPPARGPRSGAPRGAGRAVRPVHGARPRGPPRRRDRGGGWRATPATGAATRTGARDQRASGWCRPPTCTSRRRAASSAARAGAARPPWSGPRAARWTCPATWASGSRGRLSPTPDLPAQRPLTYHSAAPFPRPRNQLPRAAKMPRTRLFTQLTLIAVLVGALAACGQVGGRRRGQGPSQRGQPGGSEPTAPTEATGPSAPSGPCSAANFDGCEYPTRGLRYETKTGVTVAEPKTGRTLPLLMRLPTGQGPLPVVIWSHGGPNKEGGERASAEWGDQLAKHGYAVIHVGHTPLGAGGLDATCKVGSVPDSECVSSAFGDDAGLYVVQRSMDLQVVVDDLPRLSDISSKSGSSAFDLSKVVLAGWSGGSRGASVLLGAKVKPTDGSPLFSNPSSVPVAALLMSPSGPGFGGFYKNGTDDSWKHMRGATFTATGSNDMNPNHPDLDGAVRRQSFQYQPEDDRRWLLFSNLPPKVGGHTTFNMGDLDSTQAPVARLSRAISSSARAFLDVVVRSDDGARVWLDSDNAKLLAGEADWQHH